MSGGRGGGLLYSVARLLDIILDEYLPYLLFVGLLDIVLDENLP